MPTPHCWVTPQHPRYPNMLASTVWSVLSRRGLRWMLTHVDTLVGWHTRWLFWYDSDARFPLAVLNGLRAEKTGRAELGDLMTTFIIIYLNVFLWDILTYINLILTLSLYYAHMQQKQSYSEWVFGERFRSVHSGIQESAVTLLGFSM